MPLQPALAQVSRVVWGKRVAAAAAPPPLQPAQADIYGSPLSPSDL